MNKIIEKCFEEHKVASFYFDKEDNCVHLTGIVHQHNEDELLIAHITPRGEYDGFILNKIGNLYRIDYEGEYENKIQRLYQLKAQAHPTVVCNEDGILFSLLKFARENQRLVSLELNTDKVTGIVKKYDNFVQLQVINENGIKNGRCIIAIDEIVTISCDTDYEQDLKILNLAKE